MLKYNTNEYEPWISTVRDIFPDHIREIAQYCHHHTLNSLDTYSSDTGYENNQQSLITSLATLNLLKPYLNKIDFIDTCNSIKQVNFVYTYPINAPFNEETYYNFLSSQLATYFNDILKINYLQIYKLIDRIDTHQDNTFLTFTITSYFNTIFDMPYTGNFEKFIYQ